MCDPYHSNIGWLCTANGIPSTKYDCSQIPGNICIAGACAVAPTVTPTQPAPTTEVICAANAGQLVPIPPTCTSCTFCNTATTTSMAPSQCASGQYCDQAARSCVDFPPDPCAYCEGQCPDPFDCSYYHTCLSSVSQGRIMCQSPTPSFDVGSKTCVVTPTTGPSVCALITLCDFSAYTDAVPLSVTTDTVETTTEVTTTTAEITTTEATTTEATTTTSKPAQCDATNVGKNYPHPGDCKK